MNTDFGDWFSYIRESIEDIRRRLEGLNDYVHNSTVTKGEFRLVLTGIGIMITILSIIVFLKG
jgi:hypothetical protein